MFHTIDTSTDVFHTCVQGSGRLARSNGLPSPAPPASKGLRLACILILTRSSSHPHACSHPYTLILTHSCLQSSSLAQLRPSLLLPTVHPNTNPYPHSHSLAISPIIRNMRMQSGILNVPKVRLLHAIFKKKMRTFLLDVHSCIR